MIGNVQAAIAEHPEEVGLLAANLIGELGSARVRVDLPDLRGAGVGRGPFVRAVPAPEENPPVVVFHIPHIASVGALRNLPVGVAVDERNAKVLKPIGDVGGCRRGQRRRDGQAASGKHSNGKPLDVISHVDLFTIC